MSDQIETNHSHERRLCLNDSDSLDGTLPSISRVLESTSQHYPILTIFCECIRDEEVDLFVQQVAALPDYLQGFLTPHTAQEYKEMGARLFLDEKGQGGYGLIDDELISVFSLPGAHLGPRIVEDAIRRGARRLDMLDAHKGGAQSDPDNPGKLLAMYSAFGFVEVARNSWSIEHAPANWNYDLWGCPDQVIMVREG